MVRRYLNLSILVVRKFMPLYGLRPDLRNVSRVVRLGHPIEITSESLENIRIEGR